MKKRLLAVTFGAMSLFSCSSSERVTSFILNDVFSSYISVAYEGYIKGLEEEATSLIKKINDLADAYKEKEIANVFTLNNTEEEVKVDPLLFSLLKEAKDIEAKSEGYFSPLLGSLTSLWKTTLYGGIAGDSSYSPTEDDIEKAKQKAPILLKEAASSSLILDESNFTVKRVGKGQIDLGAIAKGFAVKKAKELLLDKGISRYIIDGGTSSYSFGESTSDGYFRVRIKYTSDDEIVRYKVKNEDTSMSSVFEQKVEVGGKIYSHLINPKTGLPETNFASAFLIGDDSSLIDAFSTACLFADIEKVKEWESEYHFKASLFSYEGDHQTLFYENPSLLREE